MAGSLKENSIKIKTGELDSNTASHIAETFEATSEIYKNLTKHREFF